MISGVGINIKPCMLRLHLRGLYSPHYLMILEEIGVPVCVHTGLIVLTFSIYTPLFCHILRGNRMFWEKCRDISKDINSLGPNVPKCGCCGNQLYSINNEKRNNQKKPQNQAKKQNPNLKPKHITPKLHI